MLEMRYAVGDGFGNERFQHAVREVFDCLIPGNTWALLSYYTGIFSLFCGFVLGIFAVFAGVAGIRYADRNPGARGKIHAWVGIVSGVFGLALWVLFLAFLGKAACAD